MDLRGKKKNSNFRILFQASLSQGRIALTSRGTLTRGGVPCLRASARLPSSSAIGRSDDRTLPSDTHRRTLPSASAVGRSRRRAPSDTPIGEQRRTLPSASSVGHSRRRAASDTPVAPRSSQSASPPTVRSGKSAIFGLFVPVLFLEIRDPEMPLSIDLSFYCRHLLEWTYVGRKRILILGFYFKPVCPRGELPLPRVVLSRAAVCLAFALARAYHRRAPSDDRTIGHSRRTRTVGRSRRRAPSDTPIGTHRRTLPSARSVGHSRRRAASDTPVGEQRRTLPSASSVGHSRRPPRCEAENRRFSAFLFLFYFWRFATPKCPYQ
jgi:hypothetical protein